MSRAALYLFTLATAIAPGYAQFEPSPAARLNFHGIEDPLSDTKPRVGADGRGNWIAFWIASHPNGDTGGDTEIFYSRSEDHGHTWSEAATLNVDAATDLWDENVVHVASGGGNEWMAVWGRGDQIVTSHSADGGRTWGIPRQAGNFTHEPPTALVSDGNGGWYTSWLNKTWIEQDCRLDPWPVCTQAHWRYSSVWAVSTNKGNSWSKNNTSFSDYINLTSDPAGGVFRSLHSGTLAPNDSWLEYSILLYKTSVWQWATSPGTRSCAFSTCWSSPSAPVVVGDGKDTCIGAYTTNIRISRDYAQTWEDPIAVTPPGTRPEIATDSDGHWLVTWEYENQTYFISSIDNARTWSASALLLPEVAVADTQPHLVCDYNGRWVAIWASNADINGTATVDVLVSTFDFGLVEEVDGEHEAEMEGISEGEHGEAEGEIEATDEGAVDTEGLSEAEGESNSEAESVGEGSGGEGVVEGIAEGVLEGIAEGAADGEGAGEGDGAQDEAENADGEPIEGQLEGDDEGANEEGESNPIDGEGTSYEGEGTPLEGEGERAGEGEGEALAEGIDGETGEGEGGTGADVAPLARMALMIFFAADTNSDRRLSYSEFRDHQGPNLTVFDLLDTSNDGRLSIVELQRLTGGDSNIHAADTDANGLMTLNELLRVVQLYNAGGYQCAVIPEDSEDGFLPASGAIGAQVCQYHTADFQEQDGIISLGELLRVIQFLNVGQMIWCQGESEDDFCARL